MPLCLCRRHQRNQTLPQILMRERLLQMMMHMRAVEDAVEVGQLALRRGLVAVEVAFHMLLSRRRALLWRKPRVRGSERDGANHSEQMAPMAPKVPMDLGLAAQIELRGRELGARLSGPSARQ